MIKILGIDPGLRFLGWGVIQIQSNTYVHCGHGTIQANPSLEMGQRLADIFLKLQSVIEEFSPTEAAIEETFVNKNEASALKLGMARGVAMLVPSLHRMRVFEYAANTIKKTVVGAGHADKAQVVHMVQLLLPKSNVIQKDSADALAVALCHAHHRDMLMKTGT